MTGKGNDFENSLPKDITTPDLQTLFSDIDTILSEIPEDNRWNLFYTRGHTSGGPKREWYSQDVVPFDIDEIRKIDGKIDHDFEPDVEGLLAAIFEVLGVDRDKCIVVFSGNGLQILVQPERPIADKKFFNDMMPSYAVMALKINEALKKKGLPGRTDTSVFTPNGIFRLPGTTNRKPGKPERKVLLLNAKLEPQPFKISPKAKGLKTLDPWETGKGESLAPGSLSYSKLDEPKIEGGCQFLVSAKAAPEDLSEGQWYAMLSILGRFSDKEKVHEYSQGHPGYSRAETDLKTAHALSASGPRTCEGIDRLWGGCSSCPYQGFVKSPLQIKSKDHIETEKSGFHRHGKAGAIPMPSDLQLFFAKTYEYLVSEESGAVFVFDGKMYQRWPDNRLRGFAQEHFSPAVDERNIQEFRHAVTRTNFFKPGFFQTSIRGYVNFQNGVYDIEAGKLIEHSAKFGFMYVLPFSYEPGHGAPNFEKFVSAFTMEDEETALVLKEFLGYAICDTNYDYQKSLVFLGTGSNGKSTFFKVIEMLIGEENISHLTLADLSSLTAKSDLEGKLLNLCDELPSEKFGESNSFKNLFGGHTQVKKLYKDARTIRNMAKFIFSGNKMPLSNDDTDGFLRRFEFVPAKAKFKDGINADPRIAEKIRGELPGIFNIVVEAFMRAKAKGVLSTSRAGQKIHTGYRNSIDPVRHWAEEHLSVTDDFESYTTVPELFLQYRNYCDAVNIMKPSRDTFLKKLHSLIDDWEARHGRKSINGERLYVVRGVKVDKHKDTTSEF